MTNVQLRLKPAECLFMFLIILAVCALLGSLLASLFVRNGIDTRSLRLATVIQDCIMFILPSIATAIMISPQPAGFLGLDTRLGNRRLLFSALALIVSIPAMNWLVMLNGSMTFPGSLSGLEQWMRAREESASASVKILLGDDGIGSLITNLLIVGVLAGLSEELVFRGTLQRIICSTKINKHIGIWITAAIFSAIHMQFFGFFPRLILGAFFGYLFYWSASIWLPVIVHTLNNSLVVLSYWRSQTIGEGSLTDSPLNQWGAHSPALICLSVLLTVCMVFMVKNASAGKALGKTSC